MSTISAHNLRILLLVLGVICLTVVTYVTYAMYVTYVPYMHYQWPDLISGGSLSAASEAPKRTIIIVSDSRQPYIPEDGSEVPYWTLSALLNKAYADSQGAELVNYVLAEPEFAKGETPGGDEGRVACKHPTWGWRAHSWCKVPLVWHTLQTHVNADYAIYIDSDAMFRGQDLPMTLHLNHLTPFRPIGFVSDRPWASDMPCAGYFFLARRGGLDILKTWWDIDWPEKNLERDWEQAAYRRLMFEGDPGVEVSLSNPIYRDRSVILENEAQFELQDSRQLIFHSMYMYGDDRLPKLKDVWRSFWDVALDDHDALRELLKGINVQHINATEVAEDMEHFPSLRSSNSYHGMY